MSGDRIAKPKVLTPENSAEDLEKNILNKAAIRTTAATKQHDTVYANRPTTTATVYGKKIYSNLNPNAMEFVPFFKHQEPQLLKLNLESEKFASKESKESAQELLVKDLKETSLTDVGTQAGSETMENVTQENQTVDLDKKDEPNISTRTHLFLPKENSAAKNTTCEIVEHSPPSNGSENVPVEHKERTSFCSKNIETDGETAFTNIKFSNESSSEQILLIEHSEVKKSNEHSKTEPADWMKKRIEDCTANLVRKPQGGKDAGTIGLISRKTSIENKDKSKETTSTSKNQNKMFDNLTDARKKRITNTKIATIRKVNLAKPFKTAEQNKDGQPENETAIAQYKNLNKSSKTHSTARTNTKTATQTQRPEATKDLKKDTSCSTEKKIANRSYPLSTKLKSAERPVSQGQNQKEYLPIIPRATVASKLRKAETQKRRSLFFDIDSIQMTEFLFK